jgi:segregation and condensation protein B
VNDRKDILERPEAAAAKIEAILLVSPRPVPLPVLLSATDLPEPEARAALEELEKRYSPETSGIVLRHVAGGFQLATNPLCAGAIERFREEARPAPLSGAAHEVLSCVLYLGPLTRAGVSAARGVNSDAVVRGLIDRNLLAETGRDQERPGTPALLDVTEDFLLAAGARSRDDFPDLEDLVEEGEISRVRERIRGVTGEHDGEAQEKGDE